MKNTSSNYSIQSIIDWNRDIKAQNQRIKQSNILIRNTIKETRALRKKCLPLKSVLIYKH